MSRFMKVLLLSVVMLALSFGSAWAFDWDAPRLDPRHITHASMVDGKSVYVADKKTGASAPYFYYNIIRLSKIPTGLNGEMSIDLGGRANVDFYRESIEYIHTKTYPAGLTNFKVWELANYPASYFAGDENGIVAEFVVDSVSPDVISEPETEEAISERDFSFTVGNASATGKTGKIYTTAAQMASGCVPYMEMVTDGTTLTKLQWKFVDPSDISKKAIERNDKNTVARINSITIVASDRLTEDYYEVDRII